MRRIVLGFMVNVSSVVLASQASPKLTLEFDPREDSEVYPKALIFQYNVNGIDNWNKARHSKNHVISTEIRDLIGVSAASRDCPIQDIKTAQAYKQYIGCLPSSPETNVAQARFLRMLDNFIKTLQG